MNVVYSLLTALFQFNDTHIFGVCFICVLKVNIVAFSSVHPQNKTVADFFVHKPDRPRCVTVGDFSGLSAWGKHRR